MRIPADPSNDADLLMMDAAEEIDRLRTALAEAQQERDAEKSENAELRADVVWTVRNAFVDNDAFRFVNWLGADGARWITDDDRLRRTIREARRGG